MKLSIKLSETDNVATVTDTLAIGDQIVVMSDGGAEVDHIEALATVPLPYHKIALVDLAVGSPVIKYGEVVAHATAPIRRGEWVHVHNVESADLPESEVE